MTDGTIHSKLGASGSDRWMNCAGSVALLKHLDIAEETDEPEYRSEGTTAHGAAGHCLVTGEETFEILGKEFGKHKVTQEMATAVNFYIVHCLGLREDGDEVLVETGIAAPEFHPDFFGTVDYALIKMLAKLIVIRDFKYGMGIAVDTEWNSQLMYYAYGILRKFIARGMVPAGGGEWKIDLGIVQPRAFHSAGPIRTWVISANELIKWAEDTLKPAMLATALESDLNAGSWCRFCPAKLVCPLQEALFGAAMQADPKKVISLTDASLGRSYQYIAAVDKYVEALKAEVFRRLNAGAKCEGTKLVNKKGNRVWKPEAENMLKVAIPAEDLYDKPGMKSPAEIEKLGEDAAKLVKGLAYTPQTGLTVALSTDKRPEVKVNTNVEVFETALKSAQVE